MSQQIASLLFILIGGGFFTVSIITLFISIYLKSAFKISKEGWTGFLEVQITRWRKLSLSLHLREDKMEMNLFNLNLYYSFKIIAKRISRLVNYIVEILKEDLPERRPSREDLLKTFRVLVKSSFLAWKAILIEIRGRLGFEEPDTTALIAGYLYQIPPYFLNSKVVEINFEPNFLEEEINISGAVTLSSTFWKQLLFLTRIISHYSVLITIFSIFYLLIKEGD